MKETIWALVFGMFFLVGMVTEIAKQLADTQYEISTGDGVTLLCMLILATHYERKANL